MKNYIIILSIFLVGATAKAQITDTTAYLQTDILAQKSLFVGKPFSVLIDSLKVSPVSFIETTPDNNKNSEIRTTFYFKDAFKRENRIYMVIEWDTPINRTLSHKQTQENNDWMFTNQIKLLYWNKIVKDIIIKGPGI